MAHIIAKKSYVMIDTPETCNDCPLSAVTEDFERVECPLLGKSFPLEVADDHKDEDCPLKSIEIEVKFDV